MWIIYEAARRLWFQEVAVEVNLRSFAVMGLSIVVDYSRSRVLYRAARKFNSQALEADALHFQTDIWSSAVVIGGLACVKIGAWVPSLRWLEHADAVAALGVALIVVAVSWRLGARTVHALLDSAPPGIEQRIVARVAQVPGVIE